jgi:hypothetical protein
MYKLRDGLDASCQVNNSALPGLIGGDVCVNKRSTAIMVLDKNHSLGEA